MHLRVWHKVNGEILSPPSFVGKGDRLLTSPPTPLLQGEGRFHASAGVAQGEWRDSFSPFLCREGIANRSQRFACRNEIPSPPSFVGKGAGGLGYSKMRY